MTGQYIDTFISHLPGSQLIIAAMTFGPDGQVYLSCTNPVGDNPRVLRFDEDTGAFIGTFVTENQSPLEIVGFGMTFGPDHHLYIVGNGGVLRYNGQTGAFMDVFVGHGSGGLQSPTDLAFGPDGNLYIIRQDTDAVLRYNGTTGAFMDSFIEPGDNRVLGYNVLVFQPVSTGSGQH
jgi:DNA-binding beta-propeller fold protein YncE